MKPRPANGPPAPRRELYPWPCSASPWREVSHDLGRRRACSAPLAAASGPEILRGADGRPLSDQGFGATGRLRRMGIASSSAWPRRPGRQSRNSTASALLPPEPKRSATSGRTPVTSRRYHPPDSWLPCPDVDPKRPDARTSSQVVRLVAPEDPTGSTGTAGASTSRQRTHTCPRARAGATALSGHQAPRAMNGVSTRRRRMWLRNWLRGWRPRPSSRTTARRIG
jgi:hypothetical protein